MAITPAEMEHLLVALMRFQIEAADCARELAPSRTLEAARYEQDCATAALDTLRQAVFLRDREIARQPLRDVADRLGITLDEQDPDWNRLAIRALQTMISAGEESLKRDLGQSIPDCVPVFVRSQRPAVHAPNNFCDIPQEVSRQPELQNAERSSGTRSQLSDAGVKDRQDPAPTAKSLPEDSKASAKTIDDIGQAYIAARCEGYTKFRPHEQPDPATGTSWQKNSAQNVRSTLRLITAMLPVSHLTEVTDEMLAEAWKSVARLPNTFGRSPKERRTPAEAIAEANMTERKQEALLRARLTAEGASPGKIEAAILASRVPRLRAATVYRHMQDFQRIVKYAVAQGYSQHNIMEHHIWTKAEYDRRELLQEDNKRNTWIGHLDALFRTSIFQQPLEDFGDPMFWAPLISVHHGLRSEEILQLAVSDLQEIDGIWCINLRQGAGQTLKSHAGRRTIPVHRNLVDFGLIELVQRRKREGEPRLFPWIERSATKKTFTETFSKAFTAYRQTHRIYDKGRDFHSFRTTVNHCLIETDCPDTQRRYIMGHVERDVGITNYNPDGFSKKMLQKRIDAIEIDMSMVRRPFGPSNADNVTDIATLQARNRSA
ncbi:MAG: site-specific integrase [Pseudomonadota bacterium]